MVSLVRGLLTMLSDTGVEAFGYALTDQSSWWRTNISESIVLRWVWCGVTPLVNAGCETVEK